MGLQNGIYKFNYNVPILSIESILYRYDTVETVYVNGTLSVDFSSSVFDPSDEGYKIDVESIYLMSDNDVFILIGLDSEDSKEIFSEILNYLNNDLHDLVEYIDGIEDAING